MPHGLRHSDLAIGQFTVELEVIEVIFRRGQGELGLTLVGRRQRVFAGMELNSEIPV